LLPLLIISCSEARALGQTAREEVRRVDREAREAHEKKDYAAFLTASRRLAELAPRSTRARYNLACATALSGSRDEALSILERLSRMGVYFDVLSDDDLRSLRNEERFREVAVRMKALQEPLVRATELARLAEKDLLTEGVAYDPKSGDLFVGSVHLRKLVRISKGGGVKDFVKEGADGLLSAVGLALDPGRRTLYVSSVATPYARGITKAQGGSSEVLELGIEDGRLHRRIAAPSAPAGASVSDLALGPDGTLYAADSASGAVYVAEPKEEDGSFQILVPPGSMGSAQGMTVTPDGATLFVSDYTSGIWRVVLAPKPGEARILEAPDDVALTGIDGLVYYRGSLLGIRNGFRPHAIIRVVLSPGLDRIEGAEVLERADPRWDEPTLGALAGGAFVYVARSQYGRFSDEGVPGADLIEPLLLRLTLDW
jgi:sugar lactone lactonase YvrE